MSLFLSHIFIPVLGWCLSTIFWGWVYCDSEITQKLPHIFCVCVCAFAFELGVQALYIVIRPRKSRRVKLNFILFLQQNVPPYSIKIAVVFCTKVRAWEIWCFFRHFFFHFPRKFISYACHKCFHTNFYAPFVAHIPTGDLNEICWGEY